MNVFASKVGTSALRETLPNTCQVGSTSQSTPTFGTEDVPGAAAGLVAVGQEAILPVADRMQELPASNESDIRQDVEAVLGIGRIVLRFSQRVRHQRTFHGVAHVLVLLVVDRAVENVHAGDQAVAEAANHPVVGRAGEAAVVRDVVVEVPEDRMIHVALVR